MFSIIILAIAGVAAGTTGATLFPVIRETLGYSSDLGLADLPDSEIPSFDDQMKDFDPS